MCVYLYRCSRSTLDRDAALSHIMDMIADAATLRDEELAAKLMKPGQAAQDAFHQLYDRYARRLLGFLGARVPTAEVEDVHHEVWLRVWKHAATKFDGRHFRGWLFRIAHNCAVERGRRQHAA